MPVFDVFNGDADGLIARHQFRLAHPVAETPLLVTGVKREIELLKRVDASAGDQVNVFDISWDQNTDAAATLLSSGAHLRYFDHHRAGRYSPHPKLEAFIDETPDICTSLIVNRYLNGKHQIWAIAGAFGDNLHASARGLADDAGLSEDKAAQLRQLGECLNYNAYGDSIEDLHYPPAALAIRLQPFKDPFDFIANEDVVTRLAAGYAEDMANAEQLTAAHANDTMSLYVLPDEAWARRVSGVFANHLVHSHPQRAHAVATPDRQGTATVSIRAPLDHLRGASEVAQRFPGGGGRPAAAGINRMPISDMAKLVAAMKDVFGRN
jgi:hypothetical protein